MKLTVVRHGETIENARKIIMGQRPGQLSITGKDQAKKLAKRLSKEKFDIIYCSDLKRTKDTAKEIIKYHKNTPIIYDKRIRESSFGNFEGMPRLGKTAWDQISGDFLKRKAPGGESLIDLRKRVKEFLTYIKKKHPDESLLIITHAGVIRMMHSLLTNLNIKKAYNLWVFKNTNVTKYEINGKEIEVHLINDASHL